MPQFDVVQLSDRSYAVVLQADLLDEVATRVVAPLVRHKDLKPIKVLQPIFRVGRRDYMLKPDQMGAVLVTDIARVVYSAKDREWDLRRALDMVFVGF